LLEISFLTSKPDKNTMNRDPHTMNECYSSDESAAADALTMLAKSASKTATTPTPFQARTCGSVLSPVTSETKQEDDLDSAIPKKKKEKKNEAGTVDLDRILVNYHSPPPTASRCTGRKSPFRSTYRQRHAPRHYKKETRDEVNHHNRDGKSGQATAKRLDNHDVPSKRDDDFLKRLYTAHDDDPRFSTP
jgi:hypothetical protein